MGERLTTSRIDRYMLIVLMVSVFSNALLIYRLRQQRAIDLQVHTVVASTRALTTPEAAEVSGSDAPSLGPVDAPTTIVVFSDFQCIYCREFAKTLKDVEAQSGGGVRIVMREMPLLMHTYARPEAELATCVSKQSNSAFWELYDYFFDSADNLREDMTASGTHLMSLRPDINAEELNSCIEQHQSSVQVSKDIALAKRIGVDVTPTIFINGARATVQMRTKDNLVNFIQARASRPE